MDPQIKNILEKSAAYIERTQPLLDKQNEEKSAFVQRATKAAGVLASRGVLGQRDVNALVDKVAASPASVWDVVEKLAHMVGADTLGEVGREKVASAPEACPFERRFFGVNNDQSNGMVD